MLHFHVHQGAPPQSFVAVALKKQGLHCPSGSGEAGPRSVSDPGLRRSADRVGRIRNSQHFRYLGLCASKTAQSSAPSRSQPFRQTELLAFVSPRLCSPLVLCKTHDTTPQSNN